MTEAVWTETGDYVLDATLKKLEAASGRSSARPRSS